MCVSPAVVGWRSILEAACIQLPLGLSRHLLVMLSAVFEPAVVFLSQHASPVNHQSFASGGVDHLFLPLPPAHVMKSVLDTALSLGKSLAPESVAETLLEAQLPTGFEGTASLPQQKPTG